MSRLVEILNQLQNDLDQYSDVMEVTEEPIGIGFELTDSGETATLTIGKTTTIEEGFINLAFKIILTQDLLEKAMRWKSNIKPRTTFHAIHYTKYMQMKILS